MKRLAAVTAAALFLMPALAGAQGKKDHEFALVNIQRVIIESRRGKQAREDFLKSVRSKTGEVENYKKEVDQLNKQLTDKQKSLPAAQFEKARADAEKRVKELQRRAEDISDDLQRQESRMANNLALDIKEVAADYSKRKGYELVLESSQHVIPYASENTDITAEVIREYDSLGDAPEKK